MKKSLILTTIFGLAIISGAAATVLLNNANAETTNNSSVLESTTDTTTLGTSLGSKNETVYVITDATGRPTKTFLGNILETSESTLPVKLDISYSLNGSEISASDLAGQSGHVKITYSYTSIVTFQNKQVPFLTLTGVQLDGTKFSNLKITNGKIISEGDNTMIAGYAFAGLSEDLGTDIIPSSFTIEADVKNFALDTTYTLATNDILADLNTSKLSTIDELVNSMSQLGSGIDQILNGATQLDNGLDSLVAGVGALQSGATSLNSGASQLATGADQLSDGLSELASHNDELNTGAATVFNSLLAQSNSAISANSELAATIIEQGIAFPLTINNYSTSLPAIIAVMNTMKAQLEAIIPTLPDIAKPVYQAKLDALEQSIPTLSAAKESYDSYYIFYSGLQNYTAGVSAVATGAAELSVGTSQLLNGTVTLKAGVDTLASGAAQLSSGSKTLKAGIATFKSEGIDRLVNFANQNLANFTANARATISAAKSYKNYKSPNATSVKFIFKTPSIK